MPGKEFWNNRYGASEYAYGVEPNVFFQHQLDTLNPGTLLLPAEGEGRNAVYAASRGWKVTCFDQSEMGRKKALQLAAEKGVEIDYRIASIDDFDTNERFDAIGLVYVHLPSPLRSSFHNYMVELLNPDGRIILEAFSKEQLGRTSGGPQDLQLLYSIDELEDDFNELEDLSIEELEVDLMEGPFHEGKAMVLRLIANK